MNKKLLIGLIIVAVVILIFLFNPLDISPVSLPCPTGGCNGELCGFSMSIFRSLCGGPAVEFRCLKSCRVRNFKCDWNLKFKEKCEPCIFNCQEEYRPQIEHIEKIQQNLTREERLKLMKSFRNEIDKCFQKCSE